MHAFSMGYRNPYRDVVFDNAFNMFHADNDNEDGSKFMGCRLMHVAEESDFGKRKSEGHVGPGERADEAGTRQASFF